MSDLRLNNIKPAAGSNRNRTRVGRGNSGSKGTTAGRGYKGQKSRSGGFHKVGFEGGQMPIHRRLPKIGFSSRSKSLSDEVRLNELNNINADVIDLDVLKEAGIISSSAKKAKLILSGEVKKAVKLSGIAVTAGARKAIEAAGGTIE